MNTYYSFVRKGFIVEKVTRFIRPDRAPFPCQLYEIEVSQKVYGSVKKVIQVFTEYKGDLRYLKIEVAGLS